MTTVLLFTTDLTNRAYTDTKATLEGKGITVVGCKDTATEINNALAANAIDVMAGVRYTASNAGPTLKQRWSEGYPLMLGVEAARGDNELGHIASDLGAVSAIRTVASTVACRHLGGVVAHPITSGFAAGSSVQVYTADNWAVKATAVDYGTALGVFGDTATGDTYMTALEAGEPINGAASLAPGTTAPAPLVFCGFFYAGQYDNTADGKTLIAQAIEWLATPPSTSYVDEVLADAPLAYYRMGEASGTTLTDASGQARHGTYVNSPTLGVPGAVAGDTAAGFNGTNQSAHVPYATWMDVASITLEAWVKTTDTEGVILARDEGTGGPYYIRLHPTYGLYAAFTNEGWSGKYAYGGNPTAIADGGWHHLAATYGIDGVIRLYVDGVDVTTTSSSVAALGLATWPDIGLVIARQGGAGSLYLSGDVDDVAIYDHVLTAERIAAHHSAAASAPAAPTAPAAELTMAATAPAATASFAVEWDAAEEVTLAGSAPAATGSFSFEAAASTPQRMFVTEDTSTSKDAPTANYGTSTSVFAGTPGGGSETDPRYRFYFKVPPEAYNLPAVRLVLTRRFDDAPDTLALYRATSPWDETTLVISNQPADELLSTIQDPGGPAGSTLEIDLPAVGAYGFWLGRGSQANYASSEEPDESLRPYVIEPVAEPAPVAVELTVSAAAPAATASFNLEWDPAEEVTFAGAAPPATATFSLDVPAAPTPVVEVTLDGDAPPVTATFDLSSTQPVTVTLAGSGPAATATFTAEFDPTEEIRLAGVAPRAIAAMSLEWVPVPLMRMEVLDPSLTRAPTAVTIALFDAQPGVDVVFDIDGVVVATITADSSGAIGPVSLPVGEDVGAAGSHTITAIQPGSETASDTFTLAHGPAAAPRVVGPDARAVEIPAAETSTGVRRWVLQDLMPGGLGSYVLPHNPTTMDNPHFEKPLEAMHTTAVGGVFHVFEGAGEPVTWRFNGYCPNKEMHDTLLAYGALNRRFYVIDHRGRAWKVTFQNVDLVARKRQRTESGAWNDWAHDYTITALVYDQDWLVPA